MRNLYAVVSTNKYVNILLVLQIDKKSFDIHKYYAIL
jgi:hypothetical protein